MKRALALLLALTMVLSLCACGGNSNDGAADSGESSLTAEQQMIVDAVCAQTQSDDFAGWQALYHDFSGETPKAADVTAVKHFAIDDLEGEKLDCYLVNISADVAWWVNEEAQQGITDTQFQLFVSSDGKTVMNSILVDAGNFDGDISTPGTISTCMYYTEIDPWTMKPVYVAKTPHEKAMQRALLQWARPDKRKLVIQALHEAGREDLIGYGKECLVRPDRPQNPRMGKPQGKSDRSPAAKASGRPDKRDTRDRRDGRKSEPPRQGRSGARQNNDRKGGKRR